MTLRIGVVGGSISGCAIAAALRDGGHDVEVFESSSTDRHSQGAAIITPRDVLSRLRQGGLLQADFPSCSADAIRYQMRGSGGGLQPLGRVQLQLAGIEWGDLFRSLRAHVPSECYHAGRHVVGVDGSVADRPSLLFADGGTGGPYDLVIFADGHHSVGRSLVNHESQPGYIGYIFWRGLTDERDVGSVDVTGTVTRVIYSDGHAVFYR